MKILLNESQIERIADVVNKSKIASAELKEDLIDHLCCVAEDEMSKGKEFKAAYQTALQRVCPNGLDEIQKETVFLLTSKSRKRLDRMIYVSGFTALTGALVTAAMKMLHLPFAQLVFFATALVVVFLLLPAVFVRLLKQTSDKKKMFVIFGFIGALFLALSVVFIVFHWPGMLLFPLLAVVSVYVAVFPVFFFKIFKKSR